MKTFALIYSNMNIVSKCAIKYGTVLIVTLLFCAVCFYIKSKTAENPFFYTNLYTDILYSVKECMGSIYVLPMLYETISMYLKR